MCLLQVCENIYDVLRAGGIGASENEIEEFRSKCQQRFPLALKFRPANNSVKSSLNNHVDNCVQ